MHFNYIVILYYLYCFYSLSKRLDFDRPAHPRRLFARQALAAAHPLGHEDSGGALFGRFRSAEFFGPLGLWTGSDRRLGRFSPVFGRPFSRGWGETCPDPVAPARVKNLGFEVGMITSDMQCCP